MELISKSELVKSELLQNIVNGKYSPETEIESMRSFATQLNVSYSLVNRVYQEMAARGIIRCFARQRYFLLPNADKNAKELLSEQFEKAVLEVVRVGNSLSYSNDTLINEIKRIIKI